MQHGAENILNEERMKTSALSEVKTNQFVQRTKFVFELSVRYVFIQVNLLTLRDASPNEDIICSMSPTRIPRLRTHSS